VILNSVKEFWAFFARHRIEQEIDREYMKLMELAMLQVLSFSSLRTLS